MKNISTRALVYACHTAIWFVALITVAAERSSAVKNLLASLTGHHWTAKGSIALALFILVSLVFAKKEDPQDVSGLVKGVLVSAVSGALVIFVFYLLHYFGKA